MNSKRIIVYRNSFISLNLVHIKTFESAKHSIFRANIIHFYQNTRLNFEAKKTEKNSNKFCDKKSF